MRSRPLANTVVRIILAVIFGFMSLFHGTVMSFAKTDLAVGNTAALHATQGEDHVAHHPQVHHNKKASHSMPDTVPSCYGIGCFIALNVFVAPPAASVHLIATLSPAIERTMVAVLLDPAVPPPRF